jgi:hypothetical protein
MKLSPFLQAFVARAAACAVARDMVEIIVAGTPPFSSCKQSPGHGQQLHIKPD